MLKFPRTTLSPEDVTRVEAFLSSKLKPILPGSLNPVSYLAFGPEMKECLQVAVRTQRVSKGLEAINRELDDEKNGLLMVQKKTGQAAVERMSRLLFVTNDGSDRFYYQVASLLEDHGERVWCICLDVDSDVFGEIIAPQRGPAKAAMINDKKALASFLTALARQLSPK